jgi:hypothetical protein
MGARRGENQPRRPRAISPKEEEEEEEEEGWGYLVLDQPPLELFREPRELVGDDLPELLLLEELCAPAEESRGIGGLPFERLHLALDPLAPHDEFDERAHARQPLGEGLDLDPHRLEHVERVFI